MASLSAPHSRVCYLHHKDIGDFLFSPEHVMIPRRLDMTYRLVRGYGLLNKIDKIVSITKATREEMTAFHSPEYVDFLRDVRPPGGRRRGGKSNNNYSSEQMSGFGIDDDCPILNCRMLNEGSTDIAINWSGGLHHAQRSRASGFCHVNDVVLAILELLKKHQRVLYVNIGIHHGDGVQEAFYLTDRVMTVSFHKYGNCIPGAGDLGTIGSEAGKYYSVNVPLMDGIDDETFGDIFSAIVPRVVERFGPSAIVLQCGADSLAGDRLGSFNLTGHAVSLELLKQYRLPLMLLGGGGYTLANVARCWTYETAVALGCHTHLRDEIPGNLFYHKYGPDFKLHISPSGQKNKNTKEVVDKIKSTVLANLQRLPHAQSIHMFEVRGEKEEEGKGKASQSSPMVTSGEKEEQRERRSQRKRRLPARLVEDFEVDDSRSVSTFAALSHIASKAPGEKRPKTTSSLSAASTRKSYLPEYDAKIIEFLRSPKGQLDRGGNALWKQLQEEEFPERSWQSLRSRFITKKEDWGALDLEDIGDCAPNTAKGPGYSSNDQMRMIGFILDNELGDETGRPSIWKRAVEEAVVPGKSSHEGLRAFWRKHIMPNLDNYSLTEEDRKKLRKE